jgi:predicted aconitase
VYLNEEEKKMLNGEMGEPLRFAMELLTTLGEVNGAEIMIPIKHAHIAGLSFKTHGVAGCEWAERMADLGATVRVPTTFNVSGWDPTRDLGYPKKWTEYSKRITSAYMRMGIHGISSCVPYFVGYVPRLGESVAWAESSAVVYCNSILGARDNREGGPSALAAALTGRTPEYGMHLTENRRGDVLFKVTTPLKNITDYGALGHFIGKQINTKIAVIDGLSDINSRNDELLSMGACMAVLGAPTMFHVVGVTPEAPTLEAAFGGKTKYEVIEFGKKELEDSYHALTNAKNRYVDYVSIGCPHANLDQIKEVADLLDGKKVKDGVMFLVHTNMGIKEIARQLGYLETIEKAGAIVTQGFCSPLGDPEDFGLKVMATNSAKTAFYGPHGNRMDTWFGSIDKCVEAAVTGYWSY